MKRLTTHLEWTEHQSQKNVMITSYYTNDALISDSINFIITRVYMTCLFIRKHL